MILLIEWGAGYGLLMVIIAAIHAAGMTSSVIKIDCPVLRYENGKFPVIVLGLNRGDTLI